jgi:hypothetical protein
MLPLKKLNGKGRIEALEERDTGSSKGEADTIKFELVEPR